MHSVPNSSASVEKAWTGDERELRIEMYPRGFDDWEGTSAQLLREGLIPSDFTWPGGSADEYWEAGGLSYCLRRIRPRGFKGPQRAWLELDNWYLRRTVTGMPLDNFRAARVHEKRLALAAELARGSATEREQFSRFWQAQQDTRFQAFKALLVRKKRSRVEADSAVALDARPRSTRRGSEEGRQQGSEGAAA